ncbi:MAG: hypothetical protein ACK4E3_10615 [Brevundimonas sp.]|uniref:hypothetical protein n=1 Tax=Brevundimonas sp. TaxID=1871086 RepID=UPI00391C4959
MTDTPDIRQWLDETEGYGTRMERLVEDLENGADIIPWLEAAAALAASPPPSQAAIDVLAERQRPDRGRPGRAGGHVPGHARRIAGVARRRGPVLRVVHRGGRQQPRHLVERAMTDGWKEAALKALDEARADVEAGTEPTHVVVSFIGQVDLANERPLTVYTNQSWAVLRQFFAYAAWRFAVKAEEEISEKLNTGLTALAQEPDQ